MRTGKIQRHERRLIVPLADSTIYEKRRLPIASERRALVH
jgi:hypothetical protein